MDGNQSIDVIGKLDASMGNLMELLEEFHSQDLVYVRNHKADDHDGSNTLTKVQRARYAI